MSSSQTSKPSYKVMLIGASGVGKTTFLRQASGASLADDGIETLSSTAGTARSPRPTLGCEVAPVPVGTCTINLWEVSGTCPGENPDAYFEGSHANIYLADSLEQVTSAHEASNKYNTPTWFVFNDKLDTHVFVPGFHMVNAKTGRGVMKALENIVKELSDY